MKIYVAAASSEIDRAEIWINKLREAGLTVVCTWPQTVRNVGHANPPEATQSQRRSWALQDLDEVDSADGFWFLLPSMGHATSGAWGEWCFAFARGKLLVASGKSHSVFVGLADELHETDRQAFDKLVHISRQTP